MFIDGNTTLSKGNKILTIPKLYPRYSIHFDLWKNAKETGGVLKSVIRLTNTDTDTGKFGDHLPALQMRRHLLGIKLFGAISTRQRYIGSANIKGLISPSVWVPIQIRQDIDFDEGVFKIWCYIDGYLKIHEQIDRLPPLENITVYAGDNFMDPLDAEIRNLVVNTGKKKSFDVNLEIFDFRNSNSSFIYLNFRTTDFSL